jgi:hypothetical protein
VLQLDLLSVFNEHEGLHTGGMTGLTADPETRFLRPWLAERKTAFKFLGNVSELRLDTNERIVTSKKDEKMEEKCLFASELTHFGRVDTELKYWKFFETDTRRTISLP